MINQSPEIIDITKRMYKHACAFIDSTYFCHVQPKNTSFKMTQPLGIPEIVVLCFACEVYIKALLLLQGETKDDIKRMKHHIHSLWEKYEQLDPDSAKEFQNSFAYNYPRLEFQKNMEIIDNNFQDVRYLYEDIGTNIKSNRTFLLYFSHSLRDFCCIKIHGCNWGAFVENGCNWF